MQHLAEDTSDPSSQKAALTFLGRSVTAWSQIGPAVPNGVGNPESEGGLPGFERFIYECLLPAAFRVPSLSTFNLKDGQMLGVSAGHPVGSAFLKNE
jgi:exportin-T